MKSFKSFLNEARRNADLKVQERLNALQRLEKWSSSPDVHISYTAINKIGINPKSKFPDTPLAVYAYPLKEIWEDIKSEGVRNVRFAANTSKFIFVLKERGQRLKDVSDYTKANLQADLKKIQSMVPAEAFSKAMERAEKMGGMGATQPYHFLQVFVYLITTHLPSKKNIAKMSDILLKLGYSGFSDRKGTGQIHSAEEIQSFFLTPKSYEVVDVIELKDIDVKDERVRDMADYLKKNATKLSDDEIIKIVLKDLSLAKYMGPPRTEVLKVLVDKKQEERWTSKQHKSDDPDYDGKDYIPAEKPMYGSQVLFFYKKLPDDFLQWGLNNQDKSVSRSVLNWMKRQNQKPSDSYILANIKNDTSLLDFMPTIGKELAKEYVKHHGYQYGLDKLAGKMTEKDFMDLLASIPNFDMSSSFTYHPWIAKFLYNRLMKMKSPTDSDVSKVGLYINKGNKNPPMDLINGLKAKFPDFDFTQVGGWGFWKR